MENVVNLFSCVNHDSKNLPANLRENQCEIALARIGFRKAAFHCITGGVILWSKPSPTTALSPRTPIFFLVIVKRVKTGSVGYSFTKKQNTKEQ